MPSHVPLHRGRAGIRFRDREERPAVFHGVLPPARAHGGEEVVGPGTALSCRRAGGIVFVGEDAQTETQGQAAVGDDVQGRCPFRQFHRPVVGRDQDGCANPYAMGNGSHIGQ
jgi:hypothetical protein